ncbi:hypothetical protein A3K78_11050 [Candidatus Bathyarchaeota archaeon RBG_13_52_12]|nr:MAG: hypothetical protein A3K78_11050 [Candidatus Bathyarchaeota archaeon RBG_13_52_12]
MFEFKILISNSDQDIKLAQLIKDTLARIGELKPYLSSEYPSKDKNLVEKTRNAIEDCDFMITLLTKNSVKDQYVNQGIGYAIKTRELKNQFKMIYLIEDNLNPSGLINYKTEQVIKIDKNKSELVLHNLIWNIRKNIPNGLNSNILKLKIKCCNCNDLMGNPNEYFGFVPSQTDIKKSYSINKHSLSYYCPYCAAVNEINILTFENISLKRNRTMVVEEQVKK